jgi:hypothetical protein
MQPPPVSPWLLDVVVANADMSPEFGNFKTPIWLVIAADSLDQPFSTPQTIPSKRLTWQYPFRLTLNVPDIATSYLYISMCSYDSNREIIPIGRCRISLGSMPSGNAKMIRFPLLNGCQEVCTMRFCATISRYRPPNMTPGFGQPPGMAIHRPFG